MFSLRKVLKDVVTRLTLIVDFVIEKGTTGNYSYKKWVSGEVEIKIIGYTTFTNGYSIIKLRLERMGSAKLPLLRKGVVRWKETQMPYRFSPV